jgi:hypothetical protein
VSIDHATRRPPAYALSSGDVFGDYKIARRVGVGGMGVVYEAIDIPFGRPVALKVLAADDGDLRKRFVREGPMQSRVEHPNVVPVFATGEIDGVLFLSMKFINGPTLKNLIVSRDVTPERAIRLLAPIADAIDAAHRAELVHRDVKPQNILVDEKDVAYLSDFGVTLARGDTGMTATGDFIGTADYAAPEQASGKPAEPSDIYAFAAVLYEALTGGVPFPRESKLEVLVAHATAERPRVTDVRAELPRRLDAVVARGMAKDPAARYESARAMLADAAACLDTQTSRQRRVRGTGYRIGGVVAAVAAAATLGVALGGSGSHPDAGRDRLAHNDLLALRVPAGWHTANSNARLAGVTVRQPIVLLPDAGGAPRIVAGIATSGDPTWAPLAVTAAPRPAAHAVRLGSIEALRYDQPNSGTDSGVRRAYVTYSTSGTVVIACLFPAHVSLQPCDAAAAALSLRHSSTFSVGPDRSYAGTLSSITSRIALARKRAATRLKLARGPRGQSNVLGQLATAYRDARSLLARTTPPPQARVAHARLEAAAAKADAAYIRLADATLRGDQAQSRRANLRAREASSTLDSALVAFGPLGYRLH